MLEDISIEEQRYIREYDDGETLERVATNDTKLKSHIKTIERITGVHNEQFKAKCDGDTVEL